MEGQEPLQDKEDGCKKPLFRNLTADDTDPEASVVESLCLNCEEDGSTTLLLTKIPFFKEVVLMSFECDHCGYKNNEIQSAGEMGEKAVKIILQVSSEKDLNRQVVKSDYTSIKIPEIDFEIPSKSQKGEVTTVEGVIDRAIAGLSQDQNVRCVADPEVAKQVGEFVQKLKQLKTVQTPFTMILEDASGNSFVSNPRAPMQDPGCRVEWSARSTAEDLEVGIYAAQGQGSLPASQLDLGGEVMSFSTNCPGCASPCETNMKLTEIPHFKDVVIMATTCDACGLRTNEVKSGGGIEPLGQRITVRVTDREQFSRDVLKSDTCSLEIPELELEVGPGALGGRFTTVEGLIEATKQQLMDKGGMFSDAADDESRLSMAQFIAEMDKVLAGDKPVTIILDDPAGNSYVQSLTYPQPDPQLEVVRYNRTFDQNEVLGLNDMKTENYEDT